MIRALWAPLPVAAPAADGGRRRGGIRQQRAAEDEAAAHPAAAVAAAPPPTKSKLACGLLVDWADGDLSSVRLQMHLKNAHDDGLLHPMVSRFAALGSGRHANAAVMQLLGSLGLDSMIASVPGQDLSDIILPSSMIEMMFRDYPTMAKRALGADTTKLRQFWTTFLQQPASKAWADAHPHLAGKSVADLVSTIPCTVFLDAGPVTKRKSATVLSFTSMLSEVEEKLGQYLIGSFIKTQPGGDHGAWQLVLSDFDALASGVVSGRTVAQDGRIRFKFVLMVAKADEETRSNTFGLASYSANEPCSECLANRTNRPFTNLSDGAEWRPTEDMTVAMYKVRVIGSPPVHPLASSHYFCSRYFFFLDLMHLCDCKGFTSEVAGSILSLLIRSAASVGRCQMLIMWVDVKC